MKNHEAAELIEAIIKSLRTDPAQFQISVKVAGQQITSYGGTGMNISVTGGAAGSRTVGNQVSMNSTSIQIAQGQANAAVQEQIAALCGQLEQMAGEFRKPSPNPGVLQAAYDSLKGTWVPGVIIGVIGNLLSKAAGI
jgi:hypothetical protein